MSQGRLTIGDVEILILEDAEGVLPPTFDQLFPGVAPDQWQPYRERFPGAFATGNRWYVHFGGCLIRSRGRTILADTGIGPDPNQGFFPGMHGRMLDELVERGVAPDAVDTVWMSHAHHDHVGWNLTDQGKPTFPRARYLLHRADWDALDEIQAAFPPFIERMLLPLEGFGVLDFMTGETVLTDEVVSIPTPGHTPGHMCLLISSGGEKALILGDAFVHPAQVSEPDWLCMFDSDKDQAAETRRRLAGRMEDEAIRLLQCHFPGSGYGRIIREQGRRYWQEMALR